jgi:hypothetical protein
LCSVGHPRFRALNPANNSIVAGRIGQVNVSLLCVFLQSDLIEQSLTVWSVRSADAVRSGQVFDVRTTIPSAIQGGTPSDGIFGSLRDVLTFPEFKEDFDGATLYCGNYPRVYAVFHLRVYSKFCMFIT